MTPGGRLLSTIIEKPLAFWRGAIADRCQVRSEFFVALIPCALSHFLWSACALVSAAVLGRLAGLRFGVDILITRDICLAPADPTAYFIEIWSGCRAGPVLPLTRVDYRALDRVEVHGLPA